MADSTLTVPPPAGTAAGDGHANFGRLLAGEFTKLRTVRSTVWSFVALIVAGLGFTALISWLTVANWDQQDAAQKAQTSLNVVTQILGSGLFLGQLAICVLGVMVATTEYTTGMIRSTLLAAPHRQRMFIAKAVSFVIPVLVLGEILGFVSYFLGRAIFSSKVHTNLGDPHVLRAVAGEGLYLGMLGLFALAIGQLIRHTAGAVCTVIGLVLVLVPISGLIPGSIGKHISAYLPTNAGEQILNIYPQNQLLTAWQGYGVFAIWTAVLLGVAGWLLAKRDA
jgi:ABC-2 type transport system permease protein